MNRLLVFIPLCAVAAACGAGSASQIPTAVAPPMLCVSTTVGEVDAISAESVLHVASDGAVWLGATTQQGAQLVPIVASDATVHPTDERVTVGDRDWRVSAVADENGSFVIGLRSRHGSVGRIRAIFLGAVGDLGQNATMQVEPDGRVELDVGFRHSEPVAMMGSTNSLEARIHVAMASRSVELAAPLAGAIEWIADDESFAVPVVDNHRERVYHVGLDGNVRGTFDREAASRRQNHCETGEGEPVYTLGIDSDQWFVCARPEGASVSLLIKQRVCELIE